MLSKAPACINLRGQNETIFALIQTGVPKYSQFKLKGFSTSQLHLKKKGKHHSIYNLTISSISQPLRPLKSKPVYFLQLFGT